MGWTGWALPGDNRRAGYSASPYAPQKELDQAGIDGITEGWPLKSSSNALASWSTGVSNPSVNHP
jgi:hypothetical protein